MACRAQWLRYKCLGSAGTPSSPVPVRSFSPLAPVHLVSPLQLSQFQAELRDYPDQAAASYILTGLRDSTLVLN